jgi:hydrogenase maturation protein HypF
MPTAHIHIGGIVQGVGFRPFVFQTAQKLGLTGWVCNTNDGVHCRISGSEAGIDEVYKMLVESPPPLAVITTHSIESREEQFFDNFAIVEHSSEVAPNLILTPDLGMCDECRRELHDPTNRRYRYPFTTCTQCGPRFSITTALPYDRERTTMAPFTMCAACEAEYNDPANRRHYAQTNSCPACAVPMRLYKTKENGSELLSIDVHEILKCTVQYLRKGYIVSVKGIGGFLLMGDATNPQTIDLLRERKHRGAKPFAVMYPSLAMLENDVFITDAERTELTHRAAPIVLLRVRPETASERAPSRIAFRHIAPKLQYLGSMLPYTPLFDMILQDFGKPLVATSNNMSGSPLVYDDAEALGRYAHLADFTLTHGRDIVFPQDDSVVRFTRHDGDESSQQRIVLRRSRGFAPAFIQSSLREGGLPNSASILAMGSDLKNTFALLQNGALHISQFLGDLEDFDAQEAHTTVLQNLTQTLQAETIVVLADAHPAYHSAHLGERLANEAHEAQLVKIQHHKAHAAAVLAENDMLLLSNADAEPVLCVVWDGVGYGADGEIWGGEFFLCKREAERQGTMERAQHLEPFPYLHGNAMSRLTALSAFTLLHGEPEAEKFLRSKFTANEWTLHTNAVTNPALVAQTPLCSSIGRLFDATASVLGLCDYNDFEGEAAMLLEAAADRFFTQNGFDDGRNALQCLGLMTFKHGVLSAKPLLLELLRGMKTGSAVEELAARFHVELAGGARLVAQATGAVNVAFSGGVFQNAVLVELLRCQRSSAFQPLFHKQLSPNDENIAFGQIMYYLRFHSDN